MEKPLVFFILFFSFSFSFAQPDTLACNVYGNPENVSEYNGTNYFINSELQDYSGCSTYYPAIHVAIIDTTTCIAWGTYNCDSGSGTCGNCTMVNANHRFCNLNDSCGTCRNRIEKFFIFNISADYPEQLFCLDSLLNNDTLGGVYFLIYTWLNVDRNTILNINPNLYNTLASLGASNALLQADNVPFIFFARADDSSSAMEVVGATDTSFITLQALICNPTISSISKEEKDPDSHRDEINIFPNPATDIVTIEYSSKENTNIIFYDITGRKVMEKAIDSGEQQKINIDISVLPVGLYHIFVLQDEKIIKTEKVTVIK